MTTIFKKLWNSAVPSFLLGSMKTRAFIAFWACFLTSSSGIQLWSVIVLLQTSSWRHYHVTSFDQLKPTESLSIIRLISSLFEHWKGLFREFWPAGGVWELNAGETAVGGGSDSDWLLWTSSDGPPKLIFPVTPVTGRGDVIVDGIGDAIELKSTRSPAEWFIASKNL